MPSAFLCFFCTCTYALHPKTRNMDRSGLVPWNASQGVLSLRCDEGAALDMWTRMLTYGQVVAQMAPGRCGIVVNTPMRARSSTHLVVGSIPPPIILSFDLLPSFLFRHLPHSVVSPFISFPIGMYQDACAHVSLPTCFCLTHRMVMSHSHVIVSHPHAVCAASFVYIDWGRGRG